MSRVQPWDHVTQDFDILQEDFGEGSFGLVVKAQHRLSKRIFAIKHVGFNCPKTCEMVVREI